MAAFRNISAYKFTPLADLPALRTRVLTSADALHLKGTVLLSPEGINVFVAGRDDDVAAFVARLHTVPGLDDLVIKDSASHAQPFGHMRVKIKREIIAFGVPGIDPARKPSPKLSPQRLKEWLDEGRPVTLLDTRNDYEVALGTFRGALPAGIARFRDFPAAVRRLPPELKEQPIVMFCTGGIRCEKAGPFMQQEGFREVFQLDGGILNYFAQCGGEHYHGECFVFDERVGLDPALRETGAAPADATRITGDVTP
ncbi:oxygen-dependent tRNA uridine(34) hydroxylase TrhO [Horticoccus sp. 23ND18S-11]|uniref:oxygen-dependent tRNA uridine(34) hydroxylase TrhO n=1 Tax=Horticoccus sp. 23ND18S-11 TaxID=3391832 RepID=UPI0039C93CC6